MRVTEMKALADQNGKTYTSVYGTYNKVGGFQITDKYCKANYLDLTTYINDFFSKDCWKIKSVKKMTKSEIEKALGCEIDIVDEPLPINAKQENANEKDRELRELSDLEKILFDVINDSLRKVF